MSDKKRGQYKVISFEPNYPRTFEQFQKEMEGVWVFAEMEKNVQLKEMKKAFEIATGKPTEADKAKEKK